MGMAADKPVADKPAAGVDAACDESSMEFDPVSDQAVLATLRSSESVAGRIRRIGLNYRHSTRAGRVVFGHRPVTSSTFGNEICVPGRKSLKSISGLYCCKSQMGTFALRCVMLQSESPCRAIYTSVPAMRCEAK